VAEYTCEKEVLAFSPIASPEALPSGVELTNRTMAIENSTMMSRNLKNRDASDASPTTF
jgi:hypothetical protein